MAAFKCTADLGIFIGTCFKDFVNRADLIHKADNIAFLKGGRFKGQGKHMLSYYIPLALGKRKVALGVFKGGGGVIKAVQRTVFVGNMPVVATIIVQERAANPACLILKSRT